MVITFEHWSESQCKIALYLKQISDELYFNTPHHERHFRSYRDQQNAIRDLGKILIGQDYQLFELC